ncbi:hypothetical protein B0G80_7365 [Paraburkholderia sp. BL6669N2]|uniref:HEPN/Toprim-associated domain-containing protein n=1 Tax=Paraburkholderia sp. BL6669N2 TaxID=1938807 RepID=UPI000E21F6D4|nr:HEPN/Toprim-associated domain-containing protein [Paraburkholderia sp. BL6669N2]REG50895.1 hypothetical protein B0G80_7365 [Paraburkholderia sp. BL6669N2]
MDCIVHTTIGGYPLTTTVDQYDSWYFRPEDRIIRCRKKERLNPLTYGLPINDVSETVDVEFVYSITAATLRRRLGRAGYDRGSLEKERWEYYRKVVYQSDSKHLYFTGESAEAKSDAFRRSMLDDWLDALEHVVKSRLNPGPRVKPTESPLVDIITGAEKPPFLELEPEHGLPGFPCSTFNNMAVALLEVTDSKAVCEMDVTPFILHRDDTNFDDLLGRHEECYEL